MTTLAGRVRVILERLQEVVPSGDVEIAEQALVRLHQPLRVAFAGRVKAGKSTLLNALIGEAVAATDSTECTRLVTWYGQHSRYRAEAVHRDGRRSPLVFDRSGERAQLRVDEIDEQTVERLEVGVPSPQLAGLMLIDTPGLDSATDGISQRSREFVAPRPGDQGADVLVFLMRYLHSEDAQFLEAFTDPSAPWVDPVRSVAVLSRADELGSGRGDGLVVAAEIAERYRRNHHLRQIVSEVFPISGLLAFFAATITQREFELTTELAALPGDDLDRLLASAARFRSQSARLASSGHERGALLDRLGLAGVRMVVVASQAGLANTSGELSTLLSELSGIGPLRRMLLERFAFRAEALKAARALDLAEHLARHLPGGDGQSLRHEIERARVNAHELRELDAIRALLEGADVQVAGVGTEQLLHHLGHRGGGASMRLALGGDEEDRVDLPALAKRIQDLYEAANAGWVTRQDKEILLTATKSLELLHHRLGAARVDSDQALTQGEGHGV